MRRLAFVVVVIALLISDAHQQSFAGNRAQTIGNIFQIPIQTLTAISNFAQNTRPLGEILQRRRNPTQYQQYPRPVPVQSAPLYGNAYRSRAARIAGVGIAADGSGFRI